MIRSDKQVCWKICAHSVWPPFHIPLLLAPSDNIFAKWKKKTSPQSYWTLFRRSQKLLANTGTISRVRLSRCRMAPTKDEAAALESRLASAAMDCAYIFDELFGSKVLILNISSPHIMWIDWRNHSALSRARLGSLEQDLDLKGTKFNTITSILFIVCIYNMLTMSQWSDFVI